REGLSIRHKKTSPNGSGVPLRGFLNPPSRSPCGEAIRRHGARGWLTLRLKPPIAQSVGRCVSVKAKP
ncbi:hypothetical protein, partial [Legionella pneumophila]|uniref:hypothetical protein n=1 Tax=Legionella pneumophila TaxID=446 RepID=UPI001EE74261